MPLLWAGELSDSRLPEVFITNYKVKIYNQIAFAVTFYP